MVDRLDEERLEILRGWGAGLAGDGREELRAAGKAITVLIEEIDRLQVDRGSARGGRHQAQKHADAPAPAPAPGLTDALRERLANGPGAPVRQPSTGFPQPGSR